jgi:uncharacterized protein
MRHLRHARHSASICPRETRHRLKATVIRSAFGFGESLVAVSLLALIIPIEIAAPLAVLIRTGLQGFQGHHTQLLTRVRPAGNLRAWLD